MFGKKKIINVATQTWERFDQLPESNDHEAMERKNSQLAIKIICDRQKTTFFRFIMIPFD